MCTLNEQSVTFCDYIAHFSLLSLLTQPIIFYLCECIYYIVFISFAHFFFAFFNSFILFPCLSVSRLFSLFFCVVFCECDFSALCSLFVVLLSISSRENFTLMICFAEIGTNYHSWYDKTNKKKEIKEKKLNWSKFIKRFYVYLRKWKWQIHTRVHTYIHQSKPNKGKKSPTAANS